MSNNLSEKLVMSPIETQNYIGGFSTDHDPESMIAYYLSYGMGWIMGFGIKMYEYAYPLVLK